MGDTGAGGGVARSWVNRLGAAVVVLLGLTGATRMGAATITSVALFSGPGQSADFFDDTAPNRSQGSTSLSLLGSSASAVSFHFAANLSLDAEPVGSNQTLVFQVHYIVEIAIDAAVGESWDLAIDNSRVGALTLVDDGPGRATAQLTNSVAVVTGATLVGSLDLADVGALTGGAGGDLGFAQSASAILTGIGAQLVTIEFSYTMRTQTRRSAGDGDEAAVRMGIASGLGSFSAGSYPGSPPRGIGGDGHFVQAQLVPEPGAFLSLCVGLLGLAILGRERPRPRTAPHREPASRRNAPAPSPEIPSNPRAPSTSFP